MYYKALKSGTLKYAKGLIFRQGESEAAAASGPKYEWGVKFENLKQKYKKYFPSFQYVFAAQNNILEYQYTQAALLREDLRKQQQNDPFIRTFATAGLPGFDRLHYSNFGYRASAFELFRIISKDIYKRNLTNEVYSPSIQSVYFLSPKEHNKLVLEFDEGQNSQFGIDNVKEDQHGYVLTDDDNTFVHWCSHTPSILRGSMATVSHPDVVASYNNVANI